MNDLKFFDCNMMLGKPNFLAPYQIWKTEDILTAMSRSGIAKAMVSSFESLEYHPLDGNFAVSELCSREERFCPVWTLLPSGTGEFPKGKELSRILAENHICMVRLYPSAQRHNYTLAKWCSGEMLELLRSMHILVLLDAEELSWEALHAFLSENTELKVILTNLTYRMNRVLYPLLRQHDNFYLETSGLKGFFSIEDICQKFGSRRLLFGSGMPVSSAGAAAGIIEYANITWEEKEMIAHGNLESMIKDI